jgi:hypothetical protein
MSGTEAQELELIFELSKAHSLAKVPGKNNWVEHASDDGLPDYIGRIAKAVERSGKSTSAAIAIAISRVKKWAAGGDGVDADTQAKAAKALAAWEALKAKSGKKSKKVGLTNSAGKMVQVMNPIEVLSLSVSYSMDSVRKQFEDHVRAARNAHYKATGSYSESPRSYMWAKEIWTDKIIAKGDHGEGATTYRVDYSVDKSGKATFGTPQEVQVKYVTVKQLAESEGDIALTASNVDELLAWSDRISQAEAAKVARAITEKLSK